MWLFGVWPPPIWWRHHDPRCTAMMRHQSDCRTVGRADRRVADRASSPLLERMVIIAEDSRFKTHHGIDFIELREAMAAGGQRGASTITQQLAKNFYLSPSRSILRKLKEAVTAVRLELGLPKDRIMELYLSVVEWGPGVWGAAAASEAYFDVAPSALTPAQAASLAATLPHPLSSNPAYQPGRMAARRALILARYYGGSAPVPRPREDSLPLIPPIVVELLLDSLKVVPLLDSAADSSVHQP